MFETHRKHQYAVYNAVRKKLVNDPSILINLEEYVSDQIWKILLGALNEIRRDYDEASNLYPFWQNYPPDNRGRKPVGDQIPWLDMGEHVVGDKLPRLLQQKFSIQDCGIPVGPDKRLIIKHNEIARVTKNIANACWLFIDIKSVGPRDDQEHTVMSHNQISGDGLWTDLKKGIVNTPIAAIGSRTNHKFFCAIPPIYVLSDGTILPVITLAIKPVYSMMGLTSQSDRGQPLKKIYLISIPNGLLLVENPGYLKKYPSLFFPGKDDKSKNPKKVRARISFELLSKIASWRVKREIL